MAPILARLDSRLAVRVDGVRVMPSTRLISVSGSSVRSMGVVKPRAQERALGRAGGVASAPFRGQGGASTCVAQGITCVDVRDQVGTRAEVLVEGGSRSGLNGEQPTPGRRGGGCVRMGARDRGSGGRGEGREGAIQIPSLRLLLSFKAGQYAPSAPSPGLGAFLVW